MTLTPEEYETDSTESLEDKASAVVASIDQEVDLDELDEQLEDVELRLEVATLYRALLKDRLFTEQTEASRAVEARVRSFVKGELKTLLGLQAPKKEQPQLFSPEEIEALKAIAGKVLSKPSQPAPAVAVRPEPTVKTVVSAPKPTLRPKEVKKPIKTKAEAAVAAKPEAKKAPAGPKVVKETTTKTGEKLVVTQKNGRLIQEKFSAEGEKLDERDVTPQIASPMTLPTPTGHALTLLTEQYAAKSVDAISKTPDLSALISQVIKQGE